MNATEKQIGYIKDLVTKAFAGYVTGAITEKQADWMKVREMVLRTALSRATDSKNASDIINALQLGLKQFGLYLGETEWKNLVTTARETLCVLDNKVVEVDGKPVMTTIVCDKATAVIENPQPWGKARML